MLARDSSACLIVRANDDAVNIADSSDLGKGFPSVTVGFVISAAKTIPLLVWSNYLPPVLQPEPTPVLAPELPLVALHVTPPVSLSVLLPITF